MDIRHRDCWTPEDRPDPDSVTVWMLSLDQPAIAPGDLWNHLTDAERARAAGYKMESIREQFARCRGWLRLILGSYLSCTARDVSIETGPDGKPVLADRSNLHFNVAHSAGWALIGVAPRPIGIDLERVRDLESAAALVARYFSPEEQRAFAALPDERRREAFFRGWTCKEAVLKGIGAGMRGIERCVVELDPEREPRVLALDPALSSETWRLKVWPAGSDLMAALAVPE